MCNAKKERYFALISKVKSAYGGRSASGDKGNTQLYWCKDCVDEINLWTYWQGRNNLDARIMLVGQDWGSPWDESAKKTIEQIQYANQGLPYDYLHNNPSITDKRLITLFHEIGYDYLDRPCKDLFFTNFVLGYRGKGCSGGFRKEWANHDKPFFTELVNIIEPSIILCLGRATFEGVLDAVGINPNFRIGKYNQFLESSNNPVSVTFENGKKCSIFALAHCGVLGTFNRNKGCGNLDDVLEIQKNDWKKICPYLE